MVVSVANVVGWGRIGNLRSGLKGMTTIPIRLAELREERETEVQEESEESGWTMMVDGPAAWG
jgi:hypothetical protein